MATSNDSTTYVGGYNTTAASNVPPDSGATGKRFQGAAEIRQVKKVLKDSFPSVTGAVTATHTQLNQLATNTFTGSFTSPGIDDNANAVAVTINSSENVGIGTTSPAFKLDVTGSVGIDQRFESLKLQDSSGSSETDATMYMAFEYGASDTRIAYIGFPTNSTQDFVLKNETTSGSVYLSTSGAANGIVLAQDGDVGIGESVPDYKLDVNGSFGFTPGTSVTPADNGDVVFELTNNTTLTIKAKGSDGTVRTATVTLA